YQTTNVVELVYGNMCFGATASLSSAQVGLRGTSNADFNNRLLINTPYNWSTGTSAGTISSSSCRFENSSNTTIASGLTFRYTPPGGACNAPTSVTVG